MVMFRWALANSFKFERFLRLVSPMPPMVLLAFSHLVPAHVGQFRRDLRCSFRSPPAPSSHLTPPPLAPIRLCDARTLPLLNSSAISQSSPLPPLQGPTLTPPEPTCLQCFARPYNVGNEWHRLVVCNQHVDKHMVRET